MRLVSIGDGAKVRVPTSGVVGVSMEQWLGRMLLVLLGMDGLDVTMSDSGRVRNSEDVLVVRVVVCDVV